ncbi:pre-rRNA-processing protein ESF2 [Apiospora rasikravindrae]|uniref:18S rRNA factor 2 n=1 Tax=Apiospora rasikravindrae TaxID=990691 RepID=A0ABR1U0C3_9PEZI
MAPQKRNAFLDADESEDDIGGYESEEELQKGGSRSAKRRKVDDSQQSDEDDDDFDSQDEDEQVAKGKGKSKAKQPKKAAYGADDDEQDEGDSADEDDGDSLSGELPGLSKPLTKKNLVATEKAIKKSGVVYLSRIPPFMKPQKLRSLLEPYGKINRIFLSPEDPLAHSRRVRNGGNKKRSFTDGWVEFLNKKDAKAAVDLLNARTIGGKKGTYYRDDIWNLLYLKGFKWHNLTEQISAESAERASRMRAEISRTNKENKEFVRNVEKAKIQDTKSTKAAAKTKKETTDKKEPAPGPAPESKVRRTFEQSSMAKKKEDKLPEKTQRVMSMLL